MAGPRICAHCGQVCGDYAGGLGGILTAGGSIDLCHPNGLPDEPVMRPDCYRRVTIYGEKTGCWPASSRSLRAFRTSATPRPGRLRHELCAAPPEQQPSQGTRRR
jgi:hypothetical protein